MGGVQDPVTLLKYSNEYRKEKYCMLKSINRFMSYRAWITILEKANAGVNILSLLYLEAFSRKGPKGKSEGRWQGQLELIQVREFEAGFDYAVVIC